ncbi:putative inorganic carbon transporter subunit DabA, partial [Aquifex sp.]
PMVVGQWINMEHFFSATDNESYGSGSKVYHNVVGRIGVMTGNLSDLRTGLPSQTVLLEGKPHHEPIRLIVVVEAPLKLVQLTLKGVQSVRELVGKEWVNFVVFDPEEKKFFKYMKGEWQEVKI